MSSSRRKMPLVLPLLFFVIGACASPSPTGIYFDSGPTAVSEDGLHRLRWEGFSQIYVLPGHDFSHYEQVQLDPISIAYRHPPLPASLAARVIEPNYGISDEEANLMKRYYRNAFERALAAGNRLELVDLAKVEALRISGRIVDLVVTSPSVRNQRPDSTSFSSGVGRMSLILEVSDAQTGKVLIRIRDDRAIEGANDFYARDGLATTAALRDLFGDWADHTLKKIEKFKRLPDVPHS